MGKNDALNHGAKKGGAVVRGSETDEGPAARRRCDGGRAMIRGLFVNLPVSDLARSVGPSRGVRA